MDEYLKRTMRPEEKQNGQLEELPDISSKSVSASSVANNKWKEKMADKCG